MHNNLNLVFIKQEKVYANFILIMLLQKSIDFNIDHKIDYLCQSSARYFPFTRNTTKFLLPVA